MNKPICKTCGEAHWGRVCREEAIARLSAATKAVLIVKLVAQLIYLTTQQASLRALVYLRHGR